MAMAAAASMMAAAGRAAVAAVPRLAAAVNTSVVAIPGHGKWAAVRAVSQTPTLSDPATESMEKRMVKLEATMDSLHRDGATLRSETAALRSVTAAQPALRSKLREATTVLSICNSLAADKEVACANTDMEERKRAAMVGSICDAINTAKCK